MKQPSRITCKRAYDSPEKGDGYRALIDRIWPRGVSKQELALDDWYKELAPSSDLRKWFGHDPKRWAAFYQKYHSELEHHQETLEKLLKACDGGPLTLVYAARDTEHNNAVALKMLLEKRG